MPALIVFYAGVFRKKRRLLASFCGPALMQKLTASVSPEKQRLKAALVIISLFFLIVAAAGPQIGTRMVDVKRRGVDIMIAVDCSLSMQAEDMKPNRMTQAKRKLSDFIDALNGDRVGIIAFSGSAFLQCPLTLDYNAARMFLDLIDTNLIPYPGTAIGEAIRVGIKNFSREERKYKAMVLLTDGEDHGSGPLSAADEARKEGVKIYTVGIGSPSGEPIPVYDEKGSLAGYKKDRNGETVMSNLDEETLQKIALKTDGKYYRATSGEMDVASIYNEISKMDKKELQSRLASQYEDRFQYFLFIGIVLFVAEIMIDETRKEKSDA